MYIYIYIYIYIYTLYKVVTVSTAVQSVPINPPIICDLNI